MGRGGINKGNESCSCLSLPSSFPLPLWAGTRAAGCCGGLSRASVGRVSSFVPSFLAGAEAAEVQRVSSRSRDAEQAAGPRPALVQNGNGISHWTF